MLVIRLTRVGKKKQPTYRVVVQEKHRDPWGTSVEILGHYNPRSKELVVKEDRVKHWIGNGAQPSATVHNLLLSKKIIEGEKMKNTTKDFKEPEPKKEEAAPAADAPAEEKPAEEAPAEAPAEAPKEEAPAEEKPAEEPKEEAPAEEEKKEEDAA